jgi:anaphase-promoting complex subunit 8
MVIMARRGGGLCFFPPNLLHPCTFSNDQVALAQYSLRDFHSAEASFEEIRIEDPFRLENLDTFSNIL